MTDTTEQRDEQAAAGEELAEALAKAWLKYVTLFGEPPHGTVRQLAALIALAGVTFGHAPETTPCGRDEASH